MTLRKPKVYIVDDDAVLSYQWSGGLKAYGNDVAHFTTVEAALHGCIRDWPDVIIIDAFFTTPEGEIARNGGTGLCADLVCLARETDRVLPKIVGVSGVRVSEYLPNHVFDAVPEAVMPIRLQKPFASRTLVNEVCRLLGQRAAEQPVHETLSIV